MENILLFGFFALGLASLVFWFKGIRRFDSLTVYLLFVLVFLSTIPEFSDEASGQKLIGFSLLLLSANWVISNLLVKKWSFLIGIFSMGAFLFWQGVSIEFLSYPLIFDFKNALIIVFIAALFPYLIHLKTKLLVAFFELEDEQISKPLSIFGIGLLALMASFFGGTAGLLLAALAYYSTEVYLSKSGKKDVQASVLLLMIAFAFSFIKASAVEVSPFLHGSTILGLLIGTGIGRWILFSEKIPEIKLYKKLVYILIPALLIAFVVFIELLKEHTGGLAAFSALLVSLGLSIYQNRRSAQTLLLAFLSLSIATAIFSLTYFRKDELKEQKQLNQKFEQYINEPEDEIEPLETAKQDSVIVPVKENLSGTWKINSAQSQLNFELGSPDARTKGAFSELNGEFIFEEAVSDCKLKVELPLSGFTTFNDFRDEGMMEAAYFDAATFPKITFQSKKWKKTKKGYLITGDFTMKGIKQSLSLNFILVDKGSDKRGEYLLFTGKSTLDRTKHGMDSDPKIGDLVDFSYNIELRK